MSNLRTTILATWAFMAAQLLAFTTAFSLPWSSIRPYSPRGSFDVGARPLQSSLVVSPSLKSIAAATRTTKTTFLRFVPDENDKALMESMSEDDDDDEQGPSEDVQFMATFVANRLGRILLRKKIQEMKKIQQEKDVEKAVEEEAKSVSDEVEAVESVEEIETVASKVDSVNKELAPVASETDSVAVGESEELLETQVDIADDKEPVMLPSETVDEAASEKELEPIPAEVDKEPVLLTSQTEDEPAVAAVESSQSETDGGATEVLDEIEAQSREIEEPKESVEIGDDSDATRETTLQDTGDSTTETASDEKEETAVIASEEEETKSEPPLAVKDEEDMEEAAANVEEGILQQFSTGNYVTIIPDVPSQISMTFGRELDIERERIPPVQTPILATKSSS